MASGPEEHLSCPVCCDIFKDPVILACSHSFCKACLQNWWTAKQMLECPICKRLSSKGKPPRNLALKNLCEAFLLERASARSELLCSLHSRKLMFFCLDHQELECVVCVTSEQHTNHRIRPIDEAASYCKEELQESLWPLMSKLKLLNDVKGNYDQTAEYFTSQARCKERQLKEDFRKIHQFLQADEDDRISALREEEEQMCKTMKGEIEVLSREIAALSDTLRATNEELQAEDVLFLQSYKAAVDRVRRALLEDKEL